MPLVINLLEKTEFLTTRVIVYICFIGCMLVSGNLHANSLYRPVAGPGYNRYTLKIEPSQNNQKMSYFSEKASVTNIRKIQNHVNKLIKIKILKRIFIEFYNQNKIIQKFLSHFLIISMYII